MLPHVLSVLQVIDRHEGKFCGELIKDARDAGFDVVVRRLFQGCEPDDAIHVDWCDMNAVDACGDFPKRQLTVRLHSYELRTEWPTRMLWEQVDKLIFVSNYQRRMFLKTDPMVLPKKIVVAPATEHTRTLSLVERQGLGDVAIVGRIEAEKGLSLTAQIAATLPGRRFEWFGEDTCPYAKDYLQTHAPNIELRGELPHDQLMCELSDVRFTHLLHCSTREGFPVAVAEAMALGLIPVVHAFPGIEDTLPSEVSWFHTHDALRKLNDTIPVGQWLASWIRRASTTRLSDLVLADLKKRP